MIGIYDLNNISRNEIFNRAKDDLSAVSAKVCEIVENVQKRGDEAVREYTRRFDGAELESFEVTDREIDEAYSSAKREFIETLTRARDNIVQFHKKQLRQGFEFKTADGAILGQKVLPIERVMVYVPGGTAAYPSTVLMDVIPARIAGVAEIYMATPPTREGKINPDILTAAKIAGVSKIFKVGGAQAVAAFSYGTESIPKVDKIVGPGNIYVAAAKKMVFGTVNIDMIAGPSEILVVADDGACARCIAADMLSQAEHDRLATAILVTDSATLAGEVSDEIEKQLEALPRREIARASIENNGKIIIARSLDEVMDIANDIAPEHLELAVSNPFEYLEKVKNAGSVFLGYNTPEAVGDYYAGANHTLPTNGTARFSSPLSVDDFIKKTQYVYYSDEALKNAADDIMSFAEAEGLSGHARSVGVRRKK